jgi:hypothetical protein
MATTKVSTIFVAGLSTTTRFVEHFVVECYSNVGLTTLISQGIAKGVWNGTNFVQKGLIAFRGLTAGTTYYFRAGVVVPITGSTAWSSTYSLVAGSSTAPTGVTYSGTFIATTSGVTLVITPASVPSDIDHYEVVWTYDGSSPAAAQLPAFTTYITSGAFAFFAGGKPGDKITAFIRAVNTGQQYQLWQTIGTYTIQLVPSDAIVHQGTSPGGGDQYSYRQFSTATYPIVTGDFLEYDVYFEATCPEFKGGVDFNYTTPSANFRASGLSDQNGSPVLQSTDLISKAKGVWYHRTIDLSSLNGKTIQSWATFIEGDASGAYKMKIASVRITNGSTLKFTAFGTGAVTSTPVWANGVGETYTSVNVHTAQTSVGSINTNQLVDLAVVGTKAALTASARDINKNMFGDPDLTGSVSGTAVPLFSSIAGTMAANVEHWYQVQDGTTPTDNPEYRNHGELRICKVTATGGTKVAVLQHKKYTRFYVGLNYAVRAWVRINSGDPAPNGNLNVCYRAYDSSGNLVSTIQTNSTPGSALSSTTQLLFAYWQPYNLVPGAQYYSVEFENTSTNTDIYLTQPMLNRGSQVSEYTEDTFLTDIVQFAYEGYNFVDDGFTGSNGTNLVNHYPDTAGFEWVQATLNGTQTIQIQSNVASAQATVVASTIYVINNRSPLGGAYSVQADCVGTANTTQGGVIARYRDINNSYRLYIDTATPTLHLDKKVAGAVTSLGTFALTGQSHTLKLVVTSTGVKGYADGTLRITSADTSLAYQATEKVGLIVTTAATGDHFTWDNFKATYLQDVGTPPAPPPGGGGGGGDPGGGSGCVVGKTLITTRSGDQRMVDLWQKYALDEWTTNDDIKTYNWGTAQWEFYKPEKLKPSGVRKTFTTVFSNGARIRTSGDHRLFTAFTGDNALKMVNDMTENVDTGWHMTDGIVTVTKVKLNLEPDVVYKMELPPNRNYLANGILGHNLKPL